MYLLSQKYLDALPQLAQGKGSTIFLPSEASGVMGALGGLRALLQSSGAEGPAPAPRPGAPKALTGESGKG